MTDRPVTSALSQETEPYMTLNTLSAYLDAKEGSSSSAKLPDNDSDLVEVTVKVKQEWLDRISKWVGAYPQSADWGFPHNIARAVWEAAPKPLQPGDRVCKDSGMLGEVVGVYGSSIWVVPDGSDHPLTWPASQWERV